MSSTFRRVTACLLTFALVACGDDSTGSDGDQLTQEELNDIAEIMSVLSLEIGFTALGSGGGGPQLAEPVTQTLDPTTVPCPQGGTVVVSGSVTVDDETREFSMDLTQTHQSCRASGSSGTVYTVSGNPNISYDLDLSFDSSFDTFTMNILQGGNFSWNTNGRSGTCGISLTIDMSGSLNNQTYSGSATGSICGVSVNESL